MYDLPSRFIVIEINVELRFCTVPIKTRWKKQDCGDLCGDVPPNRQKIWRSPEIWRRQNLPPELFMKLHMKNFFVRWVFNMNSYVYINSTHIKFWRRQNLSPEILAVARLFGCRQKMWRSPDFLAVGGLAYKAPNLASSSRGFITCVPGRTWIWRDYSVLESP